jgi:two-component system, OmpR family, phosphate regulon sensor histidine kinase PhoR
VSRSLFAAILGLAILTILVALWQPSFAIMLALGAIIGFLIGFLRRKSEVFPKKEIIPPPAVSPRALLAATTEKMREGVLVVGENLRVLAANPAVRQVFTHVGESLENKRLSELTRNLSVHEAFLGALESGEQTEVKIETRGESNKRIFDLHISPFGLESDARRSAIGVFYEITQLERLETVRQEFLSNVSHEMRTPLTSILAFVETLETGAINDAENNMRFLSVIRKNAERMHRLISDILELSAIESGNITIEPRPLSLAPLVEEIKTNLAAKALERNVTIENKIAAQSIVYADAARLEQMLTNLMDNGVKFNRDGGTVTIGIEHNGNGDLIRVCDTGEGLAPEQAARIFERFYRVDRARSRAVGGTGLGLAIVKHLARLHGGEATVASQLGAGSTFTIELPRNEKSE